MPKHAAATPLSPEDFAHLVALAMACPVQQNNPADCPLHAIRQLPVRDRFQWARSRTQVEANGIFALHVACHRHYLSAQRPS